MTTRLTSLCATQIFFIPAFLRPAIVIPFSGFPPRRPPGENKNMFLIFTGDGKGKTTAAIGQAMRALGQDKRVFMIQFIKSSGYPSGEDAILSGFGSRMRFEKGGLGFVGIMGDTLPLDAHRKAALNALARAKAAMLSGDYDLVILDEMNVAIQLRLVAIGEALAFLAAAPPGVDVIFTGRSAHPDIVARADLVSEMHEIKHPFRMRVRAKRGIEY